jgi:cytochrome c-type biogenesis protein CcmH/NrfG
MTFALLALGLTLGTCWVVCRPLLRGGPGGEAPAMSWWTAVWFSTAALAGIGLSYLKVGHWDALDVGPGWGHVEASTAAVQAPPRPAGAMAPSSIAALSTAPADQRLPAADAEREIPPLITHLRSSPGDVAAWKRLAGLCEQAGLLPEAVSAYQAWARLTTGDADTLAQYAVTLAMSKGQGLAGEPEALIQRALMLAPKHPVALGLAAEAALERHDDQAALGHFKQLAAVLPPGSPERQPLAQRIAALSQRIGR